MKGVITFLGVFSTAFGLHIPQLNRPRYHNATTGQPESGMNQYIYCYDGPNCAGIRIQINIDPVPDLGHHHIISITEFSPVSITEYTFYTMEEIII